MMTELKFLSELSLFPNSSSLIMDLDHNVFRNFFPNHFWPFFFILITIKVHLTQKIGVSVGNGLSFVVFPDRMLKAVFE